MDFQSKFGRFGEASTWAGVAAGLLCLSNIVPAQYRMVCEAFAGAASTVAITLRDGKNRVQ